MRFAAYAAASTALAGATLLVALCTRPNFYSAFVWLSQSNLCLLVLTNTFLFVTLLTTSLLQKVLFGQLRAIERDHLYERAWYAVTETCLAMTVFRDEFDATVLTMFTLLLVGRIGSWLVGDRVDWLTTTQPTPLIYTRLFSTLALLIAMTGLLARYALMHVLHNGPSMMVMFAFEFSILQVSVLSICAKFALRVYFRNAVEPSSVGTWWVEITTDFFKLLLYMVFFAIIFTFYGLPLHIIRDLYITFRSFVTKIRDFIRFKKATARMDQRYPDALESDIQRDRVCIICREEMVLIPQGAGVEVDANKPKKLPCGHVLHFGCLRSWLERQQRCPTCRRTVLDEPAPTPTQPAPPQPGDAPRPPAPPGPLGAAAVGANWLRTHPLNPLNNVPQLPAGLRLPAGWAVIPAQNINVNMQQAMRFPIRPGVIPPQPPNLHPAHPIPPPPTPANPSTPTPAGQAPNQPSPAPMRRRPSQVLREFNQLSNSAEGMHRRVEAEGQALRHQLAELQRELATATAIMPPEAAHSAGTTPTTSARGTTPSTTTPAPPLQHIHLPAVIPLSSLQLPSAIPLSNGQLHDMEEESRGLAEQIRALHQANVQLQTRLGEMLRVRTTMTARTRDAAAQADPPDERRDVERTDGQETE